MKYLQNIIPYDNKESYQSLRKVMTMTHLFKSFKTVIVCWSTYINGRIFTSRSDQKCLVRHKGEWEASCFEICHMLRNYLQWLKLLQENLETLVADCCKENFNTCPLIVALNPLYRHTDFLSIKSKNSRTLGVKSMKMSVAE